jgi:hypothetical protein
MAEHYNNGPEGMPPVQRMSDSTLDWVINGVDTNGMYLDEEGHRKLRNVCHAVAEEVLARISWPERTAAVASAALNEQEAFERAWPDIQRQGGRWLARRGLGGLESGA